MQENTYKLLKDEFEISPELLRLVEEAEESIRESFEKLDDIKTYNQYKVLDVFRKCRISDMHFRWNTGYGYDDPGRDAIEMMMAGASAVQVGAAIITDPFAPVKIIEEMNQFLDEKGISSVKDIIGSVKPW